MRPPVAFAFAFFCALSASLPVSRPLAAGNPYAAAPAADHRWLPPFVVRNSPLPNVLFIFDNSNSMDESPEGEPVGSFDPRSRSEIARRALRRVIETHGGAMRIGLMAFRQGSDLRPAHLHAMAQHVSYDAATYDPLADPTPCDAAVNTRRFPNPAGGDGAHVHYDRAAAAYLPEPSPDLFCYSTAFLPRSPDPAPGATAGCSPNWYDAHLCGDSPYQCHSAKTGTADIEPDGVYTASGDRTAMDEHAGEGVARSFFLTDGDVAEGVFQLGAQVTIRYVGGAWLSGASPGGGELVVGIEDPGDAHRDELLARIATVTRYEEPYAPIQAGEAPAPIRNAGLTPLASTLGSAAAYFAGGVDPGAAAVSYRSPITYDCQKNFVVLVTDGLPTEDPRGDGNPVGAAAEAAAALRHTEVTLDGVAHTFDVQTFVIGFALPRSAAGALDVLAVAGGGDLAGRAYAADDEEQLEAALGRLLDVIARRGVSLSSAPVAADARGGVGAVYQAVFYPLLDDGTREVHWAGDLRGLFADPSGRLRESVPEASGDQVLQAGEEAGDAIVSMCYDAAAGVPRVHKARLPGDMPTADQGRDCDAAVFPFGLEDVAWLWSGGAWLAGLSDTATQRVYDQADRRRYIITGIDTPGGDGQVEAREERPFTAASFDEPTAGLLQAPDAAAAEGIVAYVRGADQAGMRPRKIDRDRDGLAETWRLGDIVYGAPVVVGPPAENLDLLCRDAGYREFALRYRDRRRVVVVGANDGMLHAFNGGLYDAQARAFRRGDPPHDLGAELWAYVPYNLLPHLRHLTDPYYGGAGHICFVDLQPVVFDARIFDGTGPEGQPGAEHPGGWGTLLAGGMRFGGRETRVEADPARPGSDVRTLRPAFFVLDITDPERPPKLLLEFSHPALGYTTSRPTALKAGDDWYLMLGSGPYPADAGTLSEAGSRQNPRLFLIDLKRMALEEDFGTGGVLSLGPPAGFVSDLTAVDFDLGDGDCSTGAVYFGTVSGSRDAGWSGNLQRVPIPKEGTPPAPVPVDRWTAGVLMETGRPMAAAVNVGLDPDGNRWVFAGSGRFLTQADGLDTSGQRFFGVKEPCSLGDDGRRTFTWGTAAAEGLRDVTAVEMTAGEAASREAFEALRADIAENRAGWALQLEEEGERVLGQSALLADVLTFTTYVPGTRTCSQEGHGNLYALIFATGSAHYEPLIGGGTDAAPGGGQSGGRIPRLLPLGQGLSALPALHVGADAVVRALVQNSSGAVLVVEQFPPGALRSGPIFWEAW